ncbi:hypothetical protein PIB30_006572 [Stylosanthes scabra]|uniref:Uncharacterized protein n=1 Tax=Stylosanthes scabra TaxID=79078 RepID=A0ABU6Y2X0_9FABA|nr:hypothetical protein [Stylosanthes scabra]
MVVNITISFALENLARLLVSEVALLSSVKDQIRSLSDELKFMNIFIKSSEGKHDNEFVREVVNQIRDVAYQIEDVVDTYVVNVNMQRSRNMLAKWFHNKDHVLMLHEVNDRINTIKCRINEIYQNKSKYDIQPCDFEIESIARNKEFQKEALFMRRKDVEEKEVVGLVHESNLIIEKLKTDSSSLNVVAIIGMGGLGKTTLARKIYNKDEVKRMFDCCAWSCVPDTYVTRDLLLSFFNCLNLSLDECKDLSLEELKQNISKRLKGKKYLVVLDDIWKTQVWDLLKEVFPKERNGSSIIITSRLKEVALYSKATLVCELPFLNEAVSWELFSKKIFGHKECPCDLEPLGRTMANNCKGLPLVIVVLAGLVGKKEQSEREWRRIKDYANWHLAQDIMVKNILKLSYDDLPHQLRPCFLYLGMYPEDYEIRARELLQLWVAEGFIYTKEAGRMNSPKVEDIADMYLDKLVERGLVQVASKRSDGGVKTCRVHDLLRDLCISESKANKFMEVCTELDVNNCNSRRMSLQCKETLWPTKDNQSHARSLLYFGEATRWDSESQGWKQIMNGFKLARVLDMNKVVLCSTSSPSGLKTLIHLRYLRMTIRDSRLMNNILDSICNLRNLETLHLMFAVGIFSESVSLPNKIWKLKSLRHVHLNYYIKNWTWGASLWRAKSGEIRMENLQTLGCINHDVQTASILNNDMFPNLTKLTLCGTKEWREERESLSKILQSLNKLHKLKLINIIIPLDPNVFATSLTKITLYSSLDSRLIKTLGRLPNLKILKILRGKIHGNVECIAGDFPQLQVLHVNWEDVKMDPLAKWIIEEGSMPLIRHCNIPETSRSCTATMTESEVTFIINTQAMNDAIVADL